MTMVQIGPKSGSGDSIGSLSTIWTMLKNRKRKGAAISILTAFSLIYVMMMLLFQLRTTTTLAGGGQDTSVRTMPFIVDFLSIGSLSRLDYLKAQRESFASHIYVRNFFNATELSDSDQECNEQLTHEDAVAISDYCNKIPKRNMFDLRRHSHAVGWLCAQKRPVGALADVLLTYQAKKEPLPHFLVLIDDDTYFDVENLHTDFGNASQVPRITSGCMFRFTLPRHQRKFPSMDLYWGGFGLMIPRASLELMLEPIQCPGHDSCEQIEQDILGEKALFQSGMSIAELLKVFDHSYRFTMYKNWTAGTGFCFHSDHIVSAFIEKYKLSELVPDAPLVGERIHPYRDSIMEQENTHICLFDGRRNACPLEGPICHYVSPTQMYEMNKGMREKNPDMYHDTMQASIILGSTR